MWRMEGAGRGVGLETGTVVQIVLPVHENKGFYCISVLAPVPAILAAAAAVFVFDECIFLN